MGLLADTIDDARRPLPNGGGSLLVRRSALGEIEPNADEAGDPAALTVYRLQKEGASAIASVAPARGSIKVSQDGPSTGINHAFDVGDPGNADMRVGKQPLPFMRGKKESNVRESRFVSTETQMSNVGSSSIPSLSVGSSSLQTASNVSNSEADSQSETSRQTEHSHGWRRVARSAPSEDLGSEVADVGAEASGASAASVAAARDLANALGNVAGAANIADVVAVAAVVEAAAVGDVAGFAGSPDALHAAHAVRGVSAPGTSAADERGPRVHIGRIDVTVLADAPAPAPRVGADGGDRHFLSRHYLRRP